MNARRFYLWLTIIAALVLLGVGVLCVVNGELARNHPDPCQEWRR